MRLPWVFNLDLKANEVKHLQGYIEDHYWIFGEQYHLVTYAEHKFEEALRRHIYKIKGEWNKVVSIDHPDKQKEMDIFMVRWIKRKDLIQNVVVELKHPLVRLGEDQLSQVKRYKRVIESLPEFNASNMTWEFYLVGNRFDSTGYIEDEIETNKQHGERNLVFHADRYKIYALKWSEVFASFEVNFNYLTEQLQMQRQKIVGTNYTSDGILAESHNNPAAAQKPEFPKG